MKKLAAVLAAVTLFLCILPMQTFAAESEVGRNVTYYADGSYSVVSITEGEQSKVSARATTYRDGTKVYTHYSSSGTVEWRATMRATFSYTGSSATCTSVDNLSVNIYDSGWSLASKSTRRSGNTAYGDVVMERSIIGGTQGVPVTLTLSCDKNGNLS